MIFMFVNADVAEMVLNKCTSTNADRNVRPDSEDFAVTFDYHFLEDGDQATQLVIMFLLLWLLSRKI